MSERPKETPAEAAANAACDVCPKCSAWTYDDCEIRKAAAEAVERDPA